MSSIKLFDEGESGNFRLFGTPPSSADVMYGQYLQLRKRQSSGHSTVA